jgi:tRNA(Ile)-lysidine synthase
MEAMRRGVPAVTGRGSGASDEAAWRAERWEFLAGWAAELGARVVTAHTRDDQAETVFMRILRDAGARGLAGMYARSPVARPFLDLPRATVAGYAEARGVRWVEDPSNARVTHLRNRVRLEMLPACERVRPGFTDWLIDLAQRAAAVRGAVAAVVDGLLGAAGATGAVVDAGTPAAGGPLARDVVRGPATVVVPAVTLAEIPAVGLRVLWPEIAARAGVTLDRRAVERLATEAEHLQPGGTIPVSNGVTVSRTVSTWVIRNPGGGATLY